ncbi:PilW family protein [Comamonas aquatica]|nr:PilW family protein [Comamonas aquatica]
MMNASFKFRDKQRGLTLVELMVAIVISLIVVLVATSALLLSRQGFTQVDAATQLRDNAKFTETLIQRLAVQAGYRDVIFAATGRPPSTSGLTTERPSIFGFNNASRKTSDRSEEATGSTASPNGSDILVLRFQSAALESGGTTTDQSLIDCSGTALGKTMVDRYESYSSVFHIATKNGEPTLMCTRWPDADDTGSASTQPLITGVESFQVLYGVDGITATDTTFATADSVTDTYLRADQITNADPAISLQRWQRVRSLRIGMILRAAPGTAIGNTDIAMHPFGTDTAATMFASDDDIGTNFTPTNDGRLRQAVTFTIHLRNPQGEE